MILRVLFLCTALAVAGMSQCFAVPDRNAAGVDASDTGRCSPELISLRRMSPLAARGTLPIPPRGWLQGVSSAQPLIGLPLPPEPPAQNWYEWLWAATPALALHAGSHAVAARHIDNYGKNFLSLYGVLLYSRALPILYECGNIAAGCWNITRELPFVTEPVEHGCGPDMFFAEAQNTTFHEQAMVSGMANIQKSFGAIGKHLWTNYGVALKVSRGKQMAGQLPGVSAYFGDVLGRWMAGVEGAMLEEIIFGPRNFSQARVEGWVVSSFSTALVPPAVNRLWPAYADPQTNTDWFVKAAFVSFVEDPVGSGLGNGLKDAMRIEPGVSMIRKCLVGGPGEVCEGFGYRTNGTGSDSVYSAFFGEGFGGPAKQLFGNFLRSPFMRQGN